MVINPNVGREGFKRIDISVEKGKNNDILGIIVHQKNEYSMITKCETGSWAGKYLKVLDTIVKIDGVIISGKEDCVKQLTEVLKNKATSTITVERPESLDAKIWAASVVNEASAHATAIKMASMYSGNKAATSSLALQKKPVLPNHVYGCANFNFGQDVKDIVISELDRIKNGGLNIPTFSIMKQDSFERGKRTTFVNDIVGEIPIVPDLSKPSMRTVGKIYMGK
uniref:PDZ domain-containing protein n=1 Tax=Strongyloides papillosus TaxID=174720 RepID=A0A0N5CGU2_STREA